MGEVKGQEIWMENIGQIIVSENNEFFWMIPEIVLFSYECCVSSPCFSFDDEIWYLVIVPSDGVEAVSVSNDWIGLFLWIKGQKSLKHPYDVQFGIKTPLDEDINICSGETDTHYCFGNYGFLNFTTEPPGCIRSGRLKIFCRIKRKEVIIRKELMDLSSLSTTVEDKSENAVAEASSEKQNGDSELTGVDRLIKNLENLLLNEWNSDVVLKNTDHQFRAHMTILGARSPVFASMFEHDMMEKKTGEVDISDCSTAEFKVFLQFLYTGNADISSVNVLDLYYIADKYQFDDLKIDCVETMKNTLTADNFCDVITLSLKHSESDLQKFATMFFCSNIRGIVKTVQWQKFLAENPTHANELIIKAVDA